MCTVDGSRTLSSPFLPCIVVPDLQVSPKGIVSFFLCDLSTDFREDGWKFPLEKRDRITLQLMRQAKTKADLDREHL